ncbi:hypothetical protein CK203_047208 [Vitis vinifera]|uniref:Uncharacterized protein n=1 Tax=Vitis vinifera TaxID=29760 RepID=A0A438HZ62_VITVI|nr:hypothetical protein CK203_047208 [Vitis vinifera]
MPLSQALWKLTETGLLTALTPRPPPQPLPPQFRMDLHCAYHQRPGHETDRCTALRHAIQDLIDRGLVHLGQPSVTQNPLPAHTTHAVPPPNRGIHFLDFADSDDHVCMMSWDDMDPEPIELGIFMRQAACLWGLRCSLPSNYFLRQPQYMRPLSSLRLPRAIVFRRQHSGSYFYLEHLASSSTHRDALTRALSQIKVDTTTTPEGLIHMMTAGRATCIVFSDDDLPPEGSDHTRPLYISVGCSGLRVPSVFLDNGSALNICSLPPPSLLDTHHPISVHPHKPSELMTALVLRIPTSFNLLLGRPWIHRDGAIPSSLHQKVKFIHEGQVVAVQSAEDMFISAEPVLQINHSDDDLLLTGFTFDEVQTLELEDFCRDFVAMSFDQHGSTIVLDMTRDMFIPTEADYLYMARLRNERVRARLTHTPFYYPVRPYTRSLADYFVRASEPHASSDGIIRGLSTTQEAELQRLVQ